MKSKKLLVLGSGESIHLLRWVRALCDEYEVFVFSLEPYKGEFVEECGEEIHLLSVSEGNSSTLVKCLSSVRRLRGLVRSIGPDLVMAHYASSYGLLARLAGGTPLIICAWGSDIFDFPRRNFLNRWILTGNLNAADELVVSSRTLKREVAKYTEKSAHVIPFGVDTELFCPGNEEKPRAGFVIGIAKRLEPESGIDRALHVLARLKESMDCDFTLRLAGEGSCADSLRSLADSLEVSDSVEWCGWIAHDELPGFYQGCDLLMFPSRAESFGVSAIEGMACGKPVVSSDAPGFRETVDAGVMGFVCQFETNEESNEMVEAIGKYTNDRTLLNDHGSKARDRVCRLYHWEACVSQMKELVDGLMSRDG